MSKRMENALKLADHCWARAYRTNPDFVEEYLEIAELVLQHRPYLTGDEFKKFCQQRKLFLPCDLHPNTWVSGVLALKRIGWIEKVGTVEPVEPHNHMPSVTWWKSKLI